MKKLNILLLLLLTVCVLQAQSVRYVDPIFSVQKESDVTYASNISILTGMPAPAALRMDIYSPVGDTETERPVVIYFHTGSFLPQYLNGQITGGKLDSTVVEVCTRLAQRGYVAIAATYRLGWAPTAPDQNVRTSTLLQAAYRGIQDARACIRFLRRSVAENSNPYGIDTDKIVLWGQGTGGYISLGTAFLDDYSELVLDKFINTNTGLPYIDTTLHGNVQGTNQTPLNLPNHLGYSADFKMAVNMGGALGDLSWIDGTPNEPVTIGYHVVTDPFAPFGNGPVIVPTTQEFVVNVSGTRTSVGRCNELGINAILDPVVAAADPLTAFVTAVANVPVDLSALGQAPTTLGTNHIYPFRTNGLGSGPWDWWNKPLLDAIIPVVNMQFGTMISSDVLHSNGLITNPDMSATKARAYIDTVMAYFIPRACQALQLPSCRLTNVNTEQLVDATLVQLRIAPNPSTGDVFFSVNTETPMTGIELFDLRGRSIQRIGNINSHNHTLQRGNIPSGMYIAKVSTKEGVTTQKLIFK